MEYFTVIVVLGRLFVVVIGVVACYMYVCSALLAVLWSAMDSAAIVPGGEERIPCYLDHDGGNDDFVALVYLLKHQHRWELYYKMPILLDSCIVVVFTLQVYIIITVYQQYKNIPCLSVMYALRTCSSCRAGTFEIKQRGVAYYYSH